MEGLILKNINKIYHGGEHAVKNCNLEADRGELLVLTGPENCGKTTLLRMIAGLEEITSGEIYLDGKPANESSLKERDVAFVFQSQSLSPHLSVYENLAYGLKIRKMPEELIEQKVNAVAEILGLSELLFRKTKVLTGIQRQRVALGRIIAREPKVILLDEPLAHLDSKLRAEMRAEILKLHARLDTIFIYSTHDPVEAMTMGSRIAVMKDGEIHQIDTPQNIYDNPADFYVSDFLCGNSTNFFNAVLAEEAGEVVLRLGEKKIALAPSVMKNLKEPLSGAKKVTVGIHREDVHTEEAFLSTAQSVIKATVSAVNTVSGKNVATFSLGGEVYLQTTFAPHISVGDEAEFAIDTERLQLFDSESGVSLKKIK